VIVLIPASSADPFWI